MSDKTPKGPGWDNAPGTGKPHDPNSIATDAEKERINKLKEELPGLLRKMQDKNHGRANQFYPYILIRSIVGDRGNRPINVPFWESPDIWTAAGDPSATPAIPPDHGGSLTAGQPHTVYAHVWKLGRAPIAGVKVEFYWFDPSFSFDASHAHLIGMTRVDLGPRSSANCHKLVKCPKAWIPQMVNNGHECLVARASAIGDNIGATHPWEPWADRHVGQRNVHVAEVNADVNLLMAVLDKTRLKETRTQLIQIGKTADVTLKMMAPKLKMDPSVETTVLAELRADGSLHIPVTRAEVPGGQAIVAGTEMKTDFNISKIARIMPHNILNIKPLSAPMMRTQPVGAHEIFTAGADLTHLFGHSSLMSAALLEKVSALKPPAKDQAHVMRLVSFQGDQIVGGYTIIVHG